VGPEHCGKHRGDHTRGGGSLAMAHRHMQSSSQEAESSAKKMGKHHVQSQRLLRTVQKESFEDCPLIWVTC
jgi:hypothetical protein